MGRWQPHSLTSSPRQNPLPLKILNPVHERVLGIANLGEPGTAQLDGADKRRWRRGGGAVGKAEIGVVVGFAEQRVDADRAQAVSGDDAVPDGRLRGQEFGH